MRLQDRPGIIESFKWRRTLYADFSVNLERGIKGFDGVKMSASGIVRINGLYHDFLYWNSRKRIIESVAGV